MKRSEYMAALLALPGAAGVLLVLVLLLVAHLQTGDASLDQLAVRGRVALALVRVFHVRLVFELRIARIFMALVNNEYLRALPIDGQLGDTASTLGPSVGLAQALRATVKQLGLWTPPPGATEDEERAAYAAEAKRVLRTLIWGARIFDAKLQLAGGDYARAVQLYNGAGDAAVIYRGRVVAFLRKRWGMELAA